MKTISLTEFNQNPSRATKLADVEEVIVLRRGVAAYRLVRVDDESDDPVEALMRTGVLVPARREGKSRSGALRVATADADLGAALDADRGRLDG